MTTANVRVLRMRMYRPPRWKTLETDTGRGAGHTRWAYATAVCSRACRWPDARAPAVPAKAQPCPWVGRPSEISEVPRCSLEVSWLGGNALLESQ